MNQKIWVIDDTPSDISIDRRHSNMPSGDVEKRRTRTDDETIALSNKGTTKNPALSFSLSLLLCGAGYLYLGRYRLGAVFASIQALLVLLLIGIFYYWDAIKNFSFVHTFEMSIFVFTGLVVILITMFLWLGSAVDAYRRTVQQLPDVYAGVDYEYLPVFANVLFPGWGHFLNGQPKRGSAYLMFGFVGLCSGLLTLAAWPIWSLIAYSPGARMFEIALFSAFLFVPLALVAWVVSVYDIFRIRIGDILRSHMPRTSAVLTLLLSISVGLHFMSGEYYMNLMDSVRTEMLQHNMTFLPEVVQSTQALLNLLLKINLA
ncbi:MAG TPA: hypothetical protein VJ974_06585 [Geopsychrobacteraceae bacterium]|nr:hypothetical protein [Geopsychrobacteraceae bacterium]